MSNLDPQTGAPRHAPVPPDVPSGGVGAAAFPPNDATPDGPVDRPVGEPAADDGSPTEGGPSSDLTREVTEPSTGGRAGDVLQELASEGEDGPQG